MTGESAAVGRPLASPRRGAGRDRAGRFVEAGFRAHALLLYVFLFLPIVVVVVFSFNGTNRNMTDWQGFSLKWYQRALQDTNIQSALWNSATIGLINAILATTFGTMAALGMQRVRRSVRSSFEALTYISVIIPEIVIALASLILFASIRDLVNPILSAVQTGPGRPLQIQLGQWSIIAAHVLFNTSLVLLLVRARLSGMDRTLTDASYDLFATPWRTFRQITFPQLLPAIVAGFLLAFTFSFDDYVITSFVSGPGSQTLPLYIFGQTRQGVTPLTNAVAAMMLLITLTVLFAGQYVVGRNGRRTGAGQGSMAGIITESA
ncbi:MAG: spermidine/putrescine transport system permease protein [Chloroflexota bacterium]|nr:spermidine/putrescine transport system permease protein [Chloroflexota bacterium]